MTPAQRMRRLRERRKAAGLKARVTRVPEESEQLTYSSHRQVEVRRRAMHAVITRKVERDPKVLAIAFGLTAEFLSAYVVVPLAGAV